MSERQRHAFDRGAFYRFCREWHGYLSAMAFAALAFFAVTGITLNHPEWFANDRAARDTHAITLSQPAIARASNSSDQARALGAAIAAAVPVRGEFASGDVVDGEALIRFEGVNGSSDVTIDLRTGRGEIETTRASLVSMLNDLHRGKNAGQVWKAAIDVVAAIILAVSAIGFILFFSLRLRLVTSLLLTAGGAGALGALYWVFVK